jgi:hypothetical protein
MNPRSQRSRRAFSVVLLVITLAGFELLSFALTELRPDLFDRREVFLSLRPEDFERFKQQAASNTLGWDNVADQKRRQPNCMG